MSSVRRFARSAMLTSPDSTVVTNYLTESSVHKGVSMVREVRCHWPESHDRVRDGFDDSWPIEPDWFSELPLRRSSTEAAATPDRCDPRPRSESHEPAPTLPNSPNRPPLDRVSPQRNRRHRVTIHVSGELRERLRRGADERDQSLSEFCRQLFEQGLQQPPTAHSSEFA